MNEVEVAMERTVELATLPASISAMLSMVEVLAASEDEARDSRICTLLVKEFKPVSTLPTRVARPKTVVDEAMLPISAESWLNDLLTQVVFVAQISPVNVRFPFMSKLNMFWPF